MTPAEGPNLVMTLDPAPSNRPGKPASTRCGSLSTTPSKRGGSRAWSSKRLVHAVSGTIGAAFNELFPSVIESDLAAAIDEGWTLGSQSAYCHRCGDSTGPGEATDKGCSHCVGQSVAWDGIVRLGPYEKPLEQWILGMKFGKAWRWADWFGRELAGVISEVGEQQQTLISHVPMPRLRRWRRGYNQAKLIAQAMAKAAKLPLVPALRRTGSPPPQSGLPKSQRHANVRDTFAIAEIDLTGYHVWLVDDVKTTGATLAACSKLLKKAGAKSVHGAVVAVADAK